MVAETQNSSLSRAKTNKEDEFYTQIEDVERELKHYRKHFKDKIVYLNCDDPRPLHNPPEAQQTMFQ